MTPLSTGSPLTATPLSTGSPLTASPLPAAEPQYSGVGSFLQPVGYSEPGSRGNGKQNSENKVSEVSRLPSSVCLDDDDVSGMLEIKLKVNGAPQVVAVVDPLAEMDRLSAIATEFTTSGPDGKIQITKPGYEDAIRGYVANLLGQPSISTHTATRVLAAVSAYCEVLKKSDPLWLASHFGTNSTPGS